MAEFRHLYIGCSQGYYKQIACPKPWSLLVKDDVSEPKWVYPHIVRFNMEGSGTDVMVTSVCLFWFLIWWPKLFVSIWLTFHVFRIHDLVLYSRERVTRGVRSAQHNTVLTQIVCMLLSLNIMAYANNSFTFFKSNFSWTPIDFCPLFTWTALGNVIYVSHSSNKSQCCLRRN